MAQGKREELRRQAIGQASLFFAEASHRSLQAFIRTGAMRTGSGGDRIPYDPAALRALVESGRLG